MSSPASPAFLAGIRAINAMPEGFLPLHAPVFGEREKALVLDTIESSFVSSVGAYVDRFEEMLQTTTGAKRAVVCVNGTAALEMSLILAGVTAGDLVITQALSFVATTNAMAHLGAEPVFLDIERENLGLAPAALKEFLDTACEKTASGCRHKATGRRIAACVPMHTFGLPCRIIDLVALCTHWGIPVVEDAAEAMGSTYHGKHCGTFGHVGALSFNGNKIVTTGGGGAILTNDAELGARAKHLTTTAKVPHKWQFYHDQVGWNFRMPNINAALGCAQLERLAEFVSEKRRRADAYAELFADTDWHFQTEPEHSRSNYWLCAVLSPNRQERDCFLEASNAAGVMTRPAWEPLHTLPMYAACPRGRLTVTEDIADRLINLPSGVQQSTGAVACAYC